MRLRVASAAIAAVVLFAGAIASAQQQPNLAVGRKSYRAHCAACHGPAGQGTPIGKSLIAPEAKSKSDEEIIRVVTNGGGPESAMLGFGKQLGDDTIYSIMLYIRDLQGQPRTDNRATATPPSHRPPLPESARQGERIFNQAGCAQCHGYTSQSESIGPDLSHIASKLTPEEIRTAVLQPSAEINPSYGTKDVILSDGTRVQGRYRGETEAQIEIANAEVTQWETYTKDDISKMRDGNRSLMPHDFNARLTLEQQEQLFSFLYTLK